MNLVYFLIVGLVAGWLAGMFMKGKGFGLVGNLVVGVIGAFLGSWLFRELGIMTYSLLGAIVAAFVGAVLLLFIIGLIKK
ncbi:MAG: GlsB/YeaQ/YmgE family stress response membrane protein [bacterium]|nr:GlsB/YeaQ/YmgE family stress response membrane protein [bacterium]